MQRQSQADNAFAKGECIIIIIIVIIIIIIHTTKGASYKDN